MKPYLVLLRVEFTLQLLLPAIRCALTAPFQPYLFSYSINRNKSSAVFSLLHLSSACAAQALPGTLLIGARTFLPLTIPESKLSSDCLVNSARILHEHILDANDYPLKIANQSIKRLDNIKGTYHIKRINLH